MSDEPEKLLIEVDRTELGCISIALDWYVGHPDSRNKGGQDTEDDFRRAQRKWDGIYRTYHALHPAVLSCNKRPLP